MYGAMNPVRGVLCGRFSRRAEGRAAKSHGAVAVEFALILPLFLALIFGIIDGGRLMMSRWLVSYAVVRGGRVASLRTSTYQNVQDAVAQSASLIGLSSANVNIAVNGTTVNSTTFATRSSGDAVHVWTTYTFTPKLKFVFTASTISIAGTTLTNVE